MGFCLILTAVSCFSPNGMCLVCGRRQTLQMHVEISEVAVNNLFLTELYTRVRVIFKKMF